MKKLAILGHFGENKTFLDGQTVKTKVVAEELQNQLGINQVFKIDTHGTWKSLLKAPLQAYQALKVSSNVLILPAHNGLRVYAPMLSFLKNFFKNKKIHYAVIGGWLPHFLKKRPILAKALKKFDGIYVETNSMKKALEKQGFENIFILPNFKHLTVLSESQLVYSQTHPLKLCTFSRVMKEKGIEDAVNSVTAVNAKLGYTAFSLDIFGQVDAEQSEWFDRLKKSFPEYIHYGGLVHFDQSVETLKDYFALLFPTHFYTEGIPGTIIDAYAAGIPVISAKWESFADIIDDGITGIGYEFNDSSDLVKKLIAIANSPAAVNSLKENCLKKSKSFDPATAIQTISNRLV